MASKNAYRRLEEWKGYRENRWYEITAYWDDDLGDGVEVVVKGGFVPGNLLDGNFYAAEVRSQSLGIRAAPYGVEDLIHRALDEWEATERKFLSGRVPG
jgi:hypothetical protein